MAVQEKCHFSPHTGQYFVVAVLEGSGESRQTLRICGVDGEDGMTQSQTGGTSLGFWTLGDVRTSESGMVSLPLYHSLLDDDPLKVWTDEKDEFIRKDPESLVHEIPLALRQHYSIDEVELSKALARKQRELEKPWTRVAEDARKKRKTRAYFDPDDKFIPKRLADELVTAHEFKTTTDTKEIYTYQDGVWQPKGEALIHAECVSKLGEEASAHNTSELLHYIQGVTYIDRSLFNANPTLINLQNGVYDLEKGELQLHSPAFLFTHKLPVVFDSEAKCLEIERFLEQVQPNSKGRQGMIELVGYCLYRRYQFHRSWMLSGNGANGKSTFINLIRSFLGPDNTVSVSLHDLEEHRFTKAALYDKHANLYPDLPSRALLQTGIFKMTTGADPLTGEKKFRDPFNFTNHAKMIFSANQVPRSSDDSDAFHRRWIIINFPNKFEGDKADPRILEKLTTPAELSGLFNLAAKAVKELLARGQFINDNTTDVKREHYIRLSDPVRSFVMDCVDASPDDFIAKDLLYEEFATYCRENNFPSVAKISFDKRLRTEAPVHDYRPRDADGRVHAWKGIKLRSDQDREEDKQAKLG
jgi:putative DNA primase/helicase